MLIDSGSEDFAVVRVIRRLTNLERGRGCSNDDYCGGHFLVVHVLGVRSSDDVKVADE